MCQGVVLPLLYTLVLCELYGLTEVCTQQVIAWLHVLMPFEAPCIDSWATQSDNFKAIRESVVRYVKVRRPHIMHCQSSNLSHLITIHWFNFLFLLLCLKSQSRSALAFSKAIEHQPRDTNAKVNQIIDYPVSEPSITSEFSTFNNLAKVDIFSRIWP